MMIIIIDVLIIVIVIIINDDFYKEEESAERVPDSTGARALLHDPLVTSSNGGKRKHNKLFYMGSDDTSEATDSPESMTGSLCRDKPFEFDEYATKRQSKGGNASRGEYSGVEHYGAYRASNSGGCRGDYSVGYKGDYSGTRGDNLGGPQQMSDSVLSDTLSVSSLNAQTSVASTDSDQVSPNPLYNFTMETDAV